MCCPKKTKKKEKKKKKKLFSMYEKSSGAQVKNAASIGVHFVAQWLTNPTRNHEVVSSIPGLAQWIKDPALP